MPNEDVGFSRKPRKCCSIRPENMDFWLSGKYQGNSSLTIFENNIQEYYPDLVRNALEVEQNKKNNISMWNEIIISKWNNQSI